MTRTWFLKNRTPTILLSVTAATIVVSALIMPASSKSSNPCAFCHSAYSEYLDILEGDSRNQLPATLKVGEARNVTVVIENIANIHANAVMSSASLTLRSQNGHFAVRVATYSVPGLLQWGTTATATWQIIGVSAGSDVLLISAVARNAHQSVTFSDTYSPAPSMVVSETAILEFPASGLLTVFLFVTMTLASLLVRRRRPNAKPC